MKKIFLLGIGAQKSGTTWLHDQLSKCTNVDLGFIKEYHVFDALFSKHCARYKQKLVSDLVNPKLNLDNLLLKKKLEFIENPDNYFNYFNGLISNNTDVQLVGDITPAYSMLHSEHFTFIKEGLTRRGFDVRVVFIMRDPFDRAWSMLRMNRDNIKRKNPEHELTTNEEQALLDTYKKPDSVLRTTYERTILEIEKVFAANEIFYGFYETFFNNENYTQLEKFLGINIGTPNFRLKINDVKISNSLSVSTKSEIVNFYSNTYSFISSRFGSKVKDIWEGYKYIHN